LVQHLITIKSLLDLAAVKADQIRFGLLQILLNAFGGTDPTTSGILQFVDIAYYRPVSALWTPVVEACIHIDRWFKLAY